MWGKKEFKKTTKKTVHSLLSGVDGTEAEMNDSELPKEDLPAYREGFAADDFNGYLSDIISIHRIVNDYRPDM